MPSYVCLSRSHRRIVRAWCRRENFSVPAASLADDPPFKAALTNLRDPHDTRIDGTPRCWTLADRRTDGVRRTGQESNCGASALRRSGRHSARTDKEREQWPQLCLALSTKFAGEGAVGLRHATLVSLQDVTCSGIEGRHKAEGRSHSASAGSVTSARYRPFRKRRRRRVAGGWGTRRPSSPEQRGRCLRRTVPYPNLNR